MNFKKIIELANSTNNYSTSDKVGRERLERVLKVFKSRSIHEKIDQLKFENHTKEFFEELIIPYFCDHKDINKATGIFFGALMLTYDNPILNKVKESSENDYKELSKWVDIVIDNMNKIENIYMEQEYQRYKMDREYLNAKENRKLKSNVNREISVEQLLIKSKWKEVWDQQWIEKSGYDCWNRRRKDYDYITLLLEENKDLDEEIRKKLIENLDSSINEEFIQDLKKNKKIKEVPNWYAITSEYYVICLFIFEDYYNHFDYTPFEVMIDTISDNLSRLPIKYRVSIEEKYYNKILKLNDEINSIIGNLQNEKSGDENEYIKKGFELKSSGRPSREETTRIIAENLFND